MNDVLTGVSSSSSFKETDLGASVGSLDAHSRRVLKYVGAEFERLVVALETPNSIDHQAASPAEHLA